MESNLPKAAQPPLQLIQVYKLENFDTLFGNNFHLYRLDLFMEHFLIILSFIPHDDPGSRQGGLGILISHRNLAGGQ